MKKKEKKACFQYNYLPPPPSNKVGAASFVNMYK